MHQFYIETYGCQMNTADSALVEQLLLDAGFTRAAELREADIILLNTCTVRGHAAERVHGRFTQLLALRALRPRLVLGMLGCLAQHQGDEVWRAFPFLDLVVGPDSYRRLPAMLAAVLRSQGRLLDVKLSQAETYADLEPAARYPGCRAYVTVQRGCDRFCAYCIVPRVRGRERSVPPAAVLRQVQGVVEQGYPEVCLLGQTVNSYAHEGVEFPELLRQVARQPGLRRVRFLSPHPGNFSPALLEVLATEPTVMPQLHLPVQSGSSRVLEAMGRQHTREDFLALVTELRRTIPGLALSTDILVGFPGEEEADLAATLSLMEEVRFQTAYLYRYSERPGTRAAARLPDVIPEREKLQRLNRAIEVQERITHEILASYIGRTVEVLVEGPAKGHPLDALGHCRENLPVVLRQAAGLTAGQVLEVRVEGSTGHTLLGRPT